MEGKNYMEQKDSNLQPTTHEKSTLSLSYNVSQISRYFIKVKPKYLISP